VLIPYHEKDCSVLPFCVESVKQYAIGANTIYVVSAENPDVECVTWISDSSLPFTLEDVAMYIKHPSRVGWYYQQLVKLCVYDYIGSSASHILLLDSDVIIRNPVKFFTEDGKTCFAMSTEHWEPYFIHMAKLIPGMRKIGPHSGVCHHMMTRREHLHGFLTHIERIHGLPAWMAILSVVDPEQYQYAGMSEYELYFNYCLKYFPDEYVLRPLIIENLSELRQINSITADMVAIHAWMRVN
jgi:hypothetical protein